VDSTCRLCLEDEETLLSALQQKRWEIFHQRQISARMKIISFSGNSLC
jgi:hypothetical protein